MSSHVISNNFCDISLKWDGRMDGRTDGPLTESYGVPNLTVSVQMEKRRRQTDRPTDRNSYRGNNRPTVHLKTVSVQMEKHKPNQSSPLQSLNIQFTHIYKQYKHACLIVAHSLLSPSQSKMIKRNIFEIS